MEFRRRSISFTPMIDVVFILLLFFLLTVQMRRDVAIPVSLGQTTGAVSTAAPVLLELGVGDTILINGAPADRTAWRSLLKSAPQTLAIRPQDINTQTLVKFMDDARAQGWDKIILVGAKP